MQRPFDILSELDKRIGQQGAGALDIESELARRIAMPLDLPTPTAVPAKPTVPRLDVLDRLRSSLKPVASHGPTPAVTARPRTPDLRTPDPAPMAQPQGRNVLQEIVPRVTQAVVGGVSGVADKATDVWTEINRLIGREGPMATSFAQALVTAPVETAAGSADALARSQGVALSGRGSPEQVRQTMRTAGEALTPEAATRSVFADPAGTLGNPDWWASVGGQTAGSIAGIVGTGGVAGGVIKGAAGGMKLAPKVLALVERHAGPAGAALMESWLEAGQGYSEALTAGATPQDAAAVAAKRFAINLPLIGATNLPVFNAATGKRVIDALIASGSEATQEGLQAVAGNVAARTYEPARPLMQGVAESALVGGLAGAGAHGVMQQAKVPILEELERRIAEPPMPGAPPAGSTSAPVSIEEELEKRIAAPIDAAPVAPTLSIEEELDKRISAPIESPVNPPRVTELPPDAIRVDPQRFQFKSDVDAEGVTKAARIEGPWSDTFSGVLLVWQDPADGQTYVVNGHHRLEAAKRLGAPLVGVRYVQAPTAEDAKLAGALTNIAEDKGTAVDAAKVLRGSPDAAATLARAGVSSKTRLARDGAALANLSDPLFQRVATGSLDEGFGVAIGEGKLTPEDQAAVVTLIERQQAKGRELTGRQVRALIQDVQSAPAVDKATDQPSMFTSLLGEDRAQSVAVEKAILRDWLMTTLGQDKRLFGYVARGNRAERLATAGNVIDVDASKAQAQQAATIADVVDRLSSSAGPVSAALTQAATRLASGENAHEVRTQLLDAARAAVNTELTGGPRDTAAGPLADFGGAGAVSRGPAPAADRGGDRGAAAVAGPADTGNPVADVLQALEQRLADRLPTGEVQPRLPGDVGAVRDVEVAQPTFHVPAGDFTLTNETAETPAHQQPLFEPQAASGGSPTRNLYTQPPQTSMEHLTGFRGRAVSEPQVIERLQQVFSRPQKSRNVLEQVVLPGARPLPVRQGHHPMLRSKAYGLYFPQESIVRLKKSGDLTTFSHELGHHIDMALFSEVGHPVGLYRNELLTMGAATTPKSKVGSPYHLAEGVAEYFRTWFADPVQAQQIAPEFTRALQDVMRGAPAFAQQLQEGQGLVRRYLAQPAAVRGSARVSVAPLGLKGRGRDVLAELRSNAERGGFLRRFAFALRDTGNLPQVLDDRRQWVDRKITQWTDRHQAIWRALQDYAPKLPASLNAYTLTRLADKAPAMAEGALRFGPRGEAGTFLGPGLEAVLRPVHDRLYPPTSRPDTPSLVTYLIALRAQELRHDGKGREPGMAENEAVSLIARTKADPDFARIEKAKDGVYAYLKALRHYAEAYGALSADQVAKMEEAAFYVPMQRVRDGANAGVAPGAAKYADRQSPIKRLFGSGRDVIDPIESIVRHTFQMTAFVERNRAARALADVISKTAGGGTVLQEIKTPSDSTTFSLKQVQDDVLTQLVAHGFIDPDAAASGMITGQFDEIFDQLATVYTPTAFGRPGERILFVVDKGKKRFFQIQDEALYQNLVALGPGSTKHLFELAGKAAEVLRAGVTLRPTFLVKNLVRDTVGALFQSRHGFIPIYDSMRGLIGQLRKDEDYRRFMAFGIQQATLLGNDRHELRSAIDAATSRPSWASTLFRPVHSPKQFLQDFSVQIESATRLGEFKLALDSGGKERRVGVLGIAQRFGDLGKARPELTEDTVTTAALAAADVTVDFSRGGTVAKEISTVSAFFNARVQGLVRAGETVRRDPLGTMLTAGAMAAIAAVLWQWNHDDEVYREIDAQRKRDYWHVRLPGTSYWLTVPKPFVWSGVANMVEAALDETLQDNPESLHPLRDFAAGAGRDLVLTIAPSIVMPTLEALANWDYYRDRSIVSPFLEKKEPDLQVNDWTSDTFRALGQALGVSPAKLEHWVTKTGGGAVRDVTGATDPLVRGTLLRQQPERPSRGLEGVPGLQALLSPHRVDSRAASVEAFYDEYERLIKAEGSFKDYAGHPDSEGRPTRPPQGQTNAGSYGRGAAQRWDPLQILRIKEGKKQLDALRDERDGVYASKLSPDEKRRRIDELHLTMARVARAALTKTKGEIPE